MADIQKIKTAAEISKQAIIKNAVKPELLNEFNNVFKEASAAAANLEANEWITKEKKKRDKQISNDNNIETISLQKIDRSSLAQLNQGVAENAANANLENINIVPLQVFLDNAIRALENVSKQESRVNDLIKQFVAGDVSEDEVVLETAKLNLSISMVTTIVQSAVQTFKEIQQIPV